MILSAGQLSYVPKKIVSLVPSQTELLHYLGLENETIAITKFCVHPETWFRHKLRIGGTKALNIEKITELEPDLIIANKEENVKEQVEALSGKFPVWVSDINNLDDAIQMIIDIGELTGKKERASELVVAIETAFDSLKENIHTHIPAAYFIWRDPYMTVGGDTFISDVMKKAGFKNVFADMDRYPEISIEQIKASGCQLVLLSSEPYPFAQKHVEELEKELPGIKIILVDGEMFSWYGNRLLHAAVYFRELATNIL